MSSSRFVKNNAKTSFDLTSSKPRTFGSIMGWFNRHKDSLESHKSTSSLSSKASNKKKKANVHGSLENIGHLSDSLPSLTLASQTSNQRPHTTAETGYQRSAGMSHSTSATLAVPKRAISSRRTISGRNRWSSYELIGAAGLSLVVEQDPEPTSSTVDESATETVAVQRPVFDLDTSDDSAHQPVPDSLATEDSADRERRRSYNEILERLQLVDVKIESCQTRRKHLLDDMLHTTSNSFNSLSEVASERSRDDRCALLLSLLSDAQSLTSYINSLLSTYIREQQTVDTNGVESNVSDRSPTTTIVNNGSSSSSTAAKTLADFSVNLRSQLTRLSECNMPSYGDGVQKTKAQIRHTDENQENTTRGSSTVAIVVVPPSAECNNIKSLSSLTSDHDAKCIDVRCSDSESAGLSDCSSVTESGKLLACDASEMSPTHLNGHLLAGERTDSKDIAELGELTVL